MVFQEKLVTIKQEICQDPRNQTYTAAGLAPLFQVDEQASLLIIGQAPGIKTQEAGQCFRDRSGDRLRDWLGVGEEEFYESGQIALLPMDFYYPGKAKSGDLPPRPFVAPSWHPRLIELMPKIRLTLLVGQYAQDYYLADKRSVTERVACYHDYLPDYVPLVHPSPRNNLWLAKHPWFEAEFIPQLQSLVRENLVRTS
ncbi:uracil-DNA glycosylase family protein [Streptococcus cuniculipharyngis]|uniref:Uracil-DNA glycosylase family protein n=1 Tax=Streptococcus cuniculipharyngis TaxID=1562651 RepID=A0A5C5SDY1_9STRE|nr:uracil-DNA glycosylase family protein [Streptococcus cuniculipharyngis]TWS98969.1 uracil-DNA glycosylase family protein [Streptococcus cuniculipharyngis]